MTDPEPFATREELDEAVARVRYCIALYEKPTPYEVETVERLAATARRALPAASAPPSEPRCEHGMLIRGPRHCVACAPERNRSLCSVVWPDSHVKQVVCDQDKGHKGDHFGFTGGESGACTGVNWPQEPVSQPPTSEPRINMKGSSALDVIANAGQPTSEGREALRDAQELAIKALSLACARAEDFGRINGAPTSTLTEIEVAERRANDAENAAEAAIVAAALRTPGAKNE